MKINKSSMELLDSFWMFQSWLIFFKAHEELQKITVSKEYACECVFLFSLSVYEE